MASVNLVSPWVDHYRKIAALFEEEPNIQVIYNNDDREVKLYVEDELKVDALSKLLPASKMFGSVTLKVTVLPANWGEVQSADVYEDAFRGNKAVDFIETVKGIGNTPFTYVVFNKKVVQYFTDDLSDYHGIKSTLYQDIAKDVLKPSSGVFFCTNT